jgi:hypothetical protein
MHFLIYSKIIPPVGVQIKSRRAAQKSGGSLPLKDAFTFKKNESACWQLTFVVGAPCLNCIKKSFWLTPPMVLTCLVRRKPPIKMIN